MNTVPLVSIIISYYNDQSFIKDAISSVLAQTYANWELILINHASQDKSRKIAHSFSNSRIRHIDLPKNFGATGNILVKEGLKTASGEYIKLLSADDILLPHALEKLVKAMQSSADTSLVFGDIQFVNEEKVPYKETWFKNRFRPNLSENEYIRHFLSGVSVFPFAGNLIKTSVLKTIPLDYISVNVADMGLWLEILLAGGKLAFVHAPVVLYRLHGGQMCNIKAISNIKRREDFESSRFIQHFLKYHFSVARLKQILPDNPLAASLKEGEEDLTSFVLALHINKNSSNSSYILAARMALSDMLDDSLLRERLEKRFNWGIKELRGDILKRPIYTVRSDGALLKNLPFHTLAYYFFRKIFFVILFRDWRHRNNDKKRKTL